MSAGGILPEGRAIGLQSSLTAAELSAAGRDLHQFITALYPICRSITGEGLRESLRIVQQRIPLEIHEVPTGTQVFDWTIPKEWNIRDAWVKNARGERVIDFQQCNLHVLNYSQPIRGKLPLAELKNHFFTLPGKPDLIPYRTSYYRDAWGFCVSENEVQRLEDGEYEFCIDSSLTDGSLSYGECYLPGRTTEEVLLTCHACHPALCNDNLSGVALLTRLAEILETSPREYSYRMLFLPGTIGAIAWLARNEHRTQRVRHGLLVSCVGDPGAFHYKRSRHGDAVIDRAVIHALKNLGQPYEVCDFSPTGYDERQFCSPGFNLPMGCLSRTPPGRFPQYHTSADNLQFVRPDALAGSLQAYLAILRILENDRRYVNQNPHCEPQLGKRGLYQMLGGLPDAGRMELAMLWALNLSDGTHSLLQIAERSGLAFPLIEQAAAALSDVHLLKPVDEPGPAANPSGCGS